MLSDTLAVFVTGGQLEGNSGITGPEGRGDIVLPQPFDHLERARAVTDQVTQADDFFNAAFDHQCIPNGPQRVNVGMNV